MGHPKKIGSDSLGHGLGRHACLEEEDQCVWGNTQYGSFYIFEELWRDAHAKLDADKMGCKKGG